MKKIFLLFLLAASIAFADSIYMIGINSEGTPVFWTLTPPDSASAALPLDLGIYPNGDPRGIAFSPSEIVYVVGDLTDSDNSVAANWTIPNGGTPSDVALISGVSEQSPTANSVAFRSSGAGLIVGRNEEGNSAYWTVAAGGAITGPIQLGTSGFATAVAFTSEGNGYIGGSDSLGNSCYWTVSAEDEIEGPFILTGGESGGAASIYTIAVAPDGSAYIGGANISGEACFWTISTMGVASSDVPLDSGGNGQVRGIGFLPNGEGILVGQSSGNASSYWLLSGGTAGMVNNLPNGSGSGSYAAGVVISSLNGAYIVGYNEMDQAVYWSLASLDGTPDYNLLSSGGTGVGYGIAIYFNTAPNPPSQLSGRYKRNDFGLVYEQCASLNWIASDSDDVVGYNVYKDGMLIGTVDSSMTSYNHHNQNPPLSALYGITAVNGSENESAQITIRLD